MKAAELNKAVQGIDVLVRCRGIDIRVLVLSEVLEECYGSAPSPDAWLLAYAKHARAIDEAVRRKQETTGSELVVLHAADIRATEGAR